MANVGAQLVIKKGDIFWVDFGVPLGSEQGGQRPALIIQNDVGNQHSETTIVAAITSTIYDIKYPFHVEILVKDSGLPSNSTIKLEQIRTISKIRLIGKASTLSADKLKEVDKALKYSLSIT